MIPQLLTGSHENSFRHWAPRTARGPKKLPHWSPPSLFRLLSNGCEKVSQFVFYSQASTSLALALGGSRIMASAQGLWSRPSEIAMPRPIPVGSVPTSLLCPSATLPFRATHSRAAVVVSAKAAAVDSPPKSNSSNSTSSARSGSLIAPEVAQDLYKDMKLGREFEEMCAADHSLLFLSFEDEASRC